MIRHTHRGLITGTLAVPIIALAATACRGWHGCRHGNSRPEQADSPSPAYMTSPPPCRRRDDGRIPEVRSSRSVRRNLPWWSVVHP
jgi:hypothetical protein